MLVCKLELQYSPIMISYILPSQKFNVIYSILDVLQPSTQEGLPVASIAQDVVVEMTSPHDDNAR